MEGKLHHPLEIVVEGNRGTRRKILGAGTRTNNKLNAHMALSRNRTQATLVGSERSQL